MARAGLGPGWDCLFANDFDRKKSQTYIENWGDAELKTADVRYLTAEDLPGVADLAWASFPCQDLSLAGSGAGLKGERSGSFWPFWALIEELVAVNRRPKIITLENVCGALTSHSGKDFATICSAFYRTGYRFGAIVIDASLFVPQSRQRLFIVAVSQEVGLPCEVTTGGPPQPWHTKAVRIAYENLSQEVQREWLWWSLPVPQRRGTGLLDLIEDKPGDVDWFSREETDRILSMMSDVNRDKVSAAQHAGRRIVGCVYKRTRVDESGRKVQRAEVRFDNMSGCLRTPAGGSSRQLIVAVDGSQIRMRLVSGRETARLMGLPDDYKLPGNYNEAYHLTGDGVVVPVVRHLAEHVFEPILDANQSKAVSAA